MKYKAVIDDKTCLVCQQFDGAEVHAGEPPHADCLNGLRCPESFETATEIYEPSGKGAGKGPDGEPLCAGCGTAKSAHKEAGGCRCVAVEATNSEPTLPEVMHYLRSQDQFPMAQTISDASAAYIKLDAACVDLKEKYAEEIEEFNAGFEAAKDGKSLDYEPSELKHDVWRAGYAWQKFDGMRERIEGLESQVKLLQKKVGVNMSGVVLVTNKQYKEYIALKKKKGEPDAGKTVDATDK